MDNQLLCERLKLARNKKGLTMAEAAQRLNISKSGYCRYENGERTPTMPTIESIAFCFNTSVDYLTGKTADIAPDYIVIKKDNDPILFEMVLELSKCDKESKKNRLLAYSMLLSQLKKEK